VSSPGTGVKSIIFNLRNWKKGGETAEEGEKKNISLKGNWCPSKKDLWRKRVGHEVPQGGKGPIRMENRDIRIRTGSILTKGMEKEGAPPKPDAGAIFSGD